jgi:hypothetical protein
MNGTSEMKTTRADAMLIQGMKRLMKKYGAICAKRKKIVEETRIEGQSKKAGSPCIISIIPVIQGRGRI